MIARASDLQGQDARRAIDVLFNTVPGQREFLLKMNLYARDAMTGELIENLVGLSIDLGPDSPRGCIYAIATFEDPFPPQLNAEKTAIQMRTERVLVRRIAEQPLFYQQEPWRRKTG